MANLKKANLVKVASTGMVLCAVDKETGETQIVEPSPDSEIGKKNYKNILSLDSSIYISFDETF